MPGWALRNCAPPCFTVEEEAIIVAFRRHTLLPLDDCLYGLQPTIPHLTRSSLHRCLERHGISRLHELDGDKPKKQRFATYAIGYVHIDIAEVSTAEGKLRLFLTIDRTNKFAVVRLVESAGRMEAAQLLRECIETVPYRMHTVLTDNGVQFTSRRQDIYDSQHTFECGYHARRLHTLRGLTPTEFILNAWTKGVNRFRLDPSHHIPGPYTLRHCVDLPAANRASGANFRVSRACGKTRNGQPCGRRIFSDQP